ncbi:MAG: hypothetical protein AAF911_12860 [Planctomycetota bacterium]
MSNSRVTYVRFVIGKRDEMSHVSQGIFQAAFSLRDSGELSPHEFEQIEDDLSWLKMHLKSPPILMDPKTERAICWFHPRAKKPIDHVRSIARVLNEYGHNVRMITSDVPGTVIYEDGWQIVAYPFRDQRGNL